MSVEPLLPPRPTSMTLFCLGLLILRERERCERLSSLEEASTGGVAPERARAKKQSRGLPTPKGPDPIGTTHPSLGTRLSTQKS